MNAQTPPPTRVEAAPDTRLHQLVYEYATAKARADAANERLNTLKTSIKAELAATAPTSAHIAVGGPQLDTTLTMRWVESWRLDVTRMKAEAPELYVQYAKKGGHWELRAEA